MTAHMTPPDFALFSQFMDHELSPDEEREVRAYLQEYPETRLQLARLEHLNQQITKTLSEASALTSLPLRPRTPECLLPEEMSAHLTRSVSPSEKARMDGHLQTCDTCLFELLEARTISSLLDPERLPPVPAHVKSQVEALWQPSLSRVVLRLAQRGLQVVRHFLTTPIYVFEIEPIAALTRGSVANTQHSALTFRLDTANVSVRATAVAARDGITLTMTWSDNEQKVLAGKHIQIRQEGLSILMARTSEQGKIQVQYLSPGTYEIACPELQVRFQLELLFEPESRGKS